MKKLKITLAISIVLGYVAILIYAGLNGYTVHPCLHDAPIGQPNNLEACVSFPNYGSYY